MATASFMPVAEIDKPKRSNVNLSFINRFSALPGVLIPVMNEPAQAADDWRIRMSALIKTLPLQGPLMGSFKVQVDFFFNPVRLYNRGLHGNLRNLKPQDVKFPVIGWYQGDTKNLETPDTVRPIVLAGDIGVHETSLLHYLGVPRLICDSEGIGDQKGKLRYLSAVSWLGYYNIFYNYYANQQEQFFSVYGVSQAYEPGAGFQQRVVLGSGELSTIESWLYQNLGQNYNSALTFMDYMSTSNVPTTTVWNNLNKQFPGFSHAPNGGLCCRTYLPDRFSVWLNSTTYSDVATSSQINPTGMITVDAIRFANHLNNMLLKTAVAGNTYDAWLLSQYGASYKPLSEVPEFIGSRSLEVTFDDVIQTAPGSEKDPLGTLGGRGLGFTGGRDIRYYCQEHGYIMAIMSIIPRVDYFQGIRHGMQLFTLNDWHVPEMDNIGFQDLLVDDFYSALTTVGDDGYPSSLDAIGKQPAYTEWMTNTNQLHGTFAQPGSTMFMVLARRFGFVKDATGEFVPKAIGGSSYINPEMFNQCFADADEYAHNFWCQFKFDIITKRAISKRVMPHL